MMQTLESLHIDMKKNVNSQKEEQHKSLKKKWMRILTHPQLSNNQHI